MKHTDLLESDLAESKPPAWQHIRRRPASKRSAVNEFQVALFCQLAKALERSILRLFSVSDSSSIPRYRDAEIFCLNEYENFITAMFACGFVCNDGKMEGDLMEVNRRLNEVIDRWSFPELSQYLHYLQRCEKWADGYSSPILDAIRSGALLKVVARLESDESLYEPI